MKLKTEKFYRENQRVTKIVINDTKLCPVQLESGSLISRHRKNYRPKTIGHDCCTTVRLPSDVKLCRDYHQHLEISLQMTHGGRSRPGQVRQPRRHVLQTQMLHLDVGSSEALNTFLEELEGEVRLVGRQSLTHTLDEDRVVGWNTKTCQTYCQPV